jgi:predicted outer membrane protein
MQAMADGHGKVLDKLTAWEAQASDPDLRKFIGDASKEVGAHKQQAEELVTKLGKTAAL